MRYANLYSNEKSLQVIIILLIFEGFGDSLDHQRFFRRKDEPAPTSLVPSQTEDNEILSVHMLVQNQQRFSDEHLD